MFHQKFGWEQVMAAGQVGGTCPPPRQGCSVQGAQNRQSLGQTSPALRGVGWALPAAAIVCRVCLRPGLSGGFFFFLSSCLYLRDHTCLVPSISLGPVRSFLSLSWDIFCLRPGISHFSRKTWYLLMQNGTARPPSGHHSF